MLQVTNPALERRCGAAVGVLNSIPNIFCWTKMGTEAGQSLAAILRRKEMERSAGDGTFAWGIGNSLGDSVELAKSLSASGDVDVLFTPMKSPAKLLDVAPTQLFLWMFYKTRSGKIAVLPDHMLVTSRGWTEKRTHYALLCRSDDPLEERQNCDFFDSAGVRNLASMNPVGASQVTSVVRIVGATASGQKPYRVAFRAKLHAEGFVKLVDPVPLDKKLISLYERTCSGVTHEDWRSGIHKLKRAAIALKRANERQADLLLA